MMIVPADFVPQTFSWIPVDSAADVLADLLLSPEPPAMVYQIENPVRQSWADALHVLASELGVARSLDYEEWLHTVDAAADKDPDANPAERLTDFFRHDFQRMADGSVVMGTDVTRSASATLRRLDAVQPETISRYIEYWRSVDYLAQH